MIGTMWHASPSLEQELPTRSLKNATMLRIALLLLFAGLLARPALADNDVALNGQLQALAASYAGKLSLYATDLHSGKTVAIDADEPVPTASVIKLTVLFDALKDVQAGQARFDERLTLNKTNQVEGSGVLALFDAPLSLTLKDVLTMMVVVSDNTGTNMAIDRLGLDNIDRRIQWLGLQNTWLYKKVFMPPTGNVPADQPKYGLGKTTAREMAEVMRRFAVCDLNAPGTQAAPLPSDQQLCDVTLGMLKNQTDRDAIPRYLPPALTTASKSGALDDVRNDVGVVFAKNGPIIISAFTRDNKDQSWTADNAALLLIGKLSAAIVSAWQ